MVEEVLDRRHRDAFGLERGQVTVVHSGSRGLGHQVCTDYVRLLDAQLRATGSTSRTGSSPARRPRRPRGAATSPRWRPRRTSRGRTGRRSRTACAARSRTCSARTSRKAPRRCTTSRTTSRRWRPTAARACASTARGDRAFPAGSDEIPAAYRSVGQPVFIPGSMGTASFVLAGEPAAMQRSFGTRCHGAGRRLSRTAARKRSGPRAPPGAGGTGHRRPLPVGEGLAEEAPFAYKDVDRVVGVVEQAGLARRVAASSRSAS